MTVNKHHWNNNSSSNNNNENNQDPNNQQRSAAAGIVAASSASGAAPPPPAAASAARPKSVSQWSVVDVQKWFRKSCGEYYSDYAEKLLEQDITGRSLIRLSEISLLRLGIANPEHRQAIWREIAKLRLRTNILLLRDLERRQQQEAEVHQLE